MTLAGIDPATFRFVAQHLNTVPRSPIFYGSDENIGKISRHLLLDWYMIPFKIRPFLANIRYQKSLTFSLPFFLIHLLKVSC